MKRTAIQVGDTVHTRTGWSPVLVGTVYAFSACQMEGCRGVRVWTRWSDKRTTRPCSRGLKALKSGHWQIL